MKIKLASLFLFFFLIVHVNVQAQEINCDAKYEVNAGSDIDVCEGGQVNLYGSMGGDANRVKWTGGKGDVLPTRESLEISYVPTPEEYGTEITLVLEADNSKLKCPPAKSEGHIRVSPQPIANAGANQRICEGGSAQLHGTVKGKAKEIIWKTNGTGTFDNKNNMDAVYTPSIVDIAQGGCSLEMLAIPFGVCQPDSAAIVLTIWKAPVFTTESDKVIIAGQPVKLFINADPGVGTILWTSKGNGKFTEAAKAETVYNPSEEETARNTAQLEVSVSTLNGSCVTKKPVKILINPERN